VKKILASIFLFIIVIFWAVQAYAMGGTLTNEGPDLKFLYGVINFVLLIFLIVYFLKKPAKEYFSSRSLKTKMAVENSKKLYDDAYRRFEEIEAKFNNADVEGKKLIASVRQQADQEKKRIVIQAKETAEKIKRDAERIASQEVVKAKQELKSEAVDLAREIAAQKIKEQITPDIQVRLGKEFISQIQRGEAS